MNNERVKKECLKLIEQSKAAYLTTIDFEGNPITRAMFNLRNKKQFPEFSKLFINPKNQFLIYISTNTSSSKISHIKEKSAINVYFCDPDDFKGVMLGGNAEIVDDMKIKQEIWLDWWTRYYPQGVNDPDYTLLRLNPRTLRYYYRLNQIKLDL
ncbi:MAG: pyridoxamine 5'-phosphate oxidase family protein [Candidatus Thorarchaeota archaeon]